MKSNKPLKYSIYAEFSVQGCYAVNNSGLDLLPNIVETLINEKNIKI